MDRVSGNDTRGDIRMPSSRKRSPNPLAGLVKKGFQVEFHSHAEAILAVDFPEILVELAGVLEDLAIPIISLVRGGGGEQETTQSLRRQLAELQWKKHRFEIRKLIDGEERESISHEVDHVRNYGNRKIALEIEWNNKDPFFDRDLENYKRLHAEGAISVGIILTRGESFQAGIRDLFAQFARTRGIETYDGFEGILSPTDRQRNAVEQRQKSMDFAEAWATAFCADKFGQATTHWRKLEDRIRRGVGNPCPLLLIGIPISVVTLD